MSLQLSIGGILCHISLDEHEFVDIDIACTEPPQKLLPEWIVRGALDEPAAVELAKRIIELRLSGYGVWHDGN